METKEPTREELVERNGFLEERLLEAEYTLKAIRNGEIDALVIRESGEEQIYTLKGADSGYRFLVESIHEGALILSSDDSIYYCNQCFGEMIQRPIHKITGTSLDLYIDQHAEITQMIQESRSCGVSKGEFLLKRDDGTRLPINLTLSSVDLNGFNATCAVVTDLSRQKHTEDEIKSHAMRLEILNKELEDFAYVASHDLQEPLRKIVTFGDRLKEKFRNDLSDEGRDLLERIQNAARRMRALIQGLLDLSRLSRFNEVLHTSDLTKIVEEVAADFEPKIAGCGAVIKSDKLAALAVYPVHIRQLFQNLIGNALKFNRKEIPIINIYGQYSEDRSQYLIFVEDNGIGFEEIYLDRIFAPFQRLHGRSEFEGTGMGLAICRKIMEQHGGSITARSKPGIGSTFILTFPVTICGDGN